MKTHRNYLLPHLLLAVALSLIAGCATVKHRGVQSRFEDAVRADNERFSSPFTEVATAYQGVAGEITPAYISQLDPKLRPNAFLLKAVALWRAGDLSQATATALEGQAEVTRLKASVPQVESGRDNVILTMLPGLTEDSRSRARFKEGGAQDVATHYDEYANRFRTALRGLSEAREKVGAATPIEVVYYWNYQCWRVLENWLFVMGQLPGERQASVNGEADAFVKTALSNANLGNPATVPDALRAVENVLPEKHPYRQLIDLERRR